MRYPQDVAWRLATQLLAVAIATVFTVSTAVAAGFDRTGGMTQALADPLAGLAPGQTTTAGLLSDAASTFPTAQTGWTAATGSLGWSGRTGHARRGALSIPAGSHDVLAQSPQFAVRTGLRYTATAWVKGGTSKTAVSAALQFFDASGAVMDAATQIAQPGADSPRWHQVMPAVGFAPTLARTGRVVLIAKSSPKVRYVDDVLATVTTGTAAPLKGPLTTRGSDILDAQQRRVVLRGVEIDGMQTGTTVPVATMLQEIGVAHSWGANTIRLPLDQDRLLPNTCATDKNYLTKIKQLVAAATVRGMLIELDLHTFAAVPCTQPRLMPMPNQQSLTFWNTLATTFANQPLVAFDLFNEPHGTSHKVWRNGGLVRLQAGVTYVAVGMQKLYDSVRAVAGNLVLLSGPDWATRPSTVPVTGLRNVAYEVHFYTCPTGPPSKASCFSPGPGGYTDPARIFSIWNGVTDAPLVMNEFGWPASNDARYDAAVISNCERRHWGGWVAFTFDSYTQGLFSLPKNTGPIEDPSVRGMAVMLGLMRN